jgi:hypothetical protein
MRMASGKRPLHFPITLNALHEIILLQSARSTTKGVLEFNLKECIAQRHLSIVQCCCGTCGYWTVRSKARMSDASIVQSCCGTCGYWTVRSKARMSDASIVQCCCGACGYWTVRSKARMSDASIVQCCCGACGYWTVRSKARMSDVSCFEERSNSCTAICASQNSI